MANLLHYSQALTFIACWKHPKLEIIDSVPQDHELVNDDSAGAVKVSMEGGKTGDTGTGEKAVDELDDLYRELAWDVSSVTSASQNHEARSELVDARLQAVVSTRLFDGIVKKSKERALEHFNGNFDGELSALLENHAAAESQFETAVDHGSNWKIDSHNASKEELCVEILRLQKKLARVEAQNEALTAGNKEKREQIARLEAQNGKIKDQ
jgi:hypothetical protein